MARITVLGAGGRMGTALIRLIVAGGEHQLVGALVEPGDPAVGRDAGQMAGLEPLGVLATDNLATALKGAGPGSAPGCEVAIDFTAPAATPGHAAACAAGGHALVVGTTGLGAAELGALQAAARRVPVIYARNMSLGVTVLTELARQAAMLLGTGFDVEITEAHHREKKDSPSGTALQLGEAVALVRGQQLADVAVLSRSGLATTARTPEAIGFSSLRGGAIVGDHTVTLAGAEELLELTHRATDRALFARGALRAAGWLQGKPAGLYSLRDVLGLPG
ncbi:MAG: 4-hydroxy-tetrahydrodipicolinate reductase [Gammaproteobacteria bacterium]|nr:4-hydroxy-tetrahydrodipicolinate reductase [Gammaproteobacteria bacterium]